MIIVIMIIITKKAFVLLFSLVFNLLNLYYTYNLTNNNQIHIVPFAELQRCRKENQLCGICKSIYY